MARGRVKAEDLMTLQMALVGYEIERQKIDERIKEIQAKIGKRRPAAAAAGPVVEEAPRKRVLSAEARKRIAQAQKRRWAEHRKKAAAAAKGESKS
jgi:hypothetical protein